MPTADSDREEMRSAIAEALRGLARAEVLAQKYYGPSAQAREHQATSVQGHVFAAHQSLKMALESFERDPTP